MNTERIYEIENRLLQSCPIWEMDESEREAQAYWMYGVLDMTQALVDELRCSEKTVYYHMSKGRPEVKPYEEPADDMRDL